MYMQSELTCSKSTMEIQEKCVKSFSKLTSDFKQVNAGWDNNMIIKSFFRGD